MVHWGWASCSVSWSRIVRRESVVQCAVWGKLTSSGGSASLAARKWGLGFERFVRTISPTTGTLDDPLSIIFPYGFPDSGIVLSMTQCLYFFSSIVTHIPTM